MQLLRAVQLYSTTRSTIYSSSFIVYVYSYIHHSVTAIFLFYTFYFYILHICSSMYSACIYVATYFTQLRRKYSIYSLRKTNKRPKQIKN
jgi:hypothetical protein